MPVALSRSNALSFILGAATLALVKKGAQKMLKKKHPANNLPILYVYDHCPYCVRVRMIMAFKKVDYVLAYLENADVETPVSLVGAKVVPILYFPDTGIAMKESLDLVAYVDAHTVHLGKIHILIFFSASIKIKIISLERREDSKIYDHLHFRSKILLF